jgi:hypothetical protein
VESRVQRVVCRRVDEPRVEVPRVEVPRTVAASESCDDASAFALTISSSGSRPRSAEEWAERCSKVLEGTRRCTT